MVSSDDEVKLAVAPCGSSEKNCWRLRRRLDISVSLCWPSSTVLFRTTTWCYRKLHLINVNVFYFTWNKPILSQVGFCILYSGSYKVWIYRYLCLLYDVLPIWYRTIWKGLTLKHKPDLDSIDTILFDQYLHYDTSLKHASGQFCKSHFKGNVQHR